MGVREEGRGGRRATARRDRDEQLPVGRQPVGGGREGGGGEGWG